VKNQHEEAKKSRAEKDEPDGVEEVCKTFGPLLDEWEREQLETEADYVADLFRYLAGDTDEDDQTDEDEDIDETDFEIEMRPNTPEGLPHMLIADRSAGGAHVPRVALGMYAPS
jgi:hypothetical protein